MAAVIPSPRESFIPIEEDLMTNKQQNNSYTTLKHFNFNFEPSKVETQLKENIQRLKTPGDEVENTFDSGAQSLVSYCSSHLPHVSTKEEDWEIPFQDIRDLEYVGSGGQGKLYSVMY